MLRDHDRDRDHGHLPRSGRLSGDSGSWHVKLRAQQTRLFPGSRRLPASRSVFRLWRGELSLRGAFSGFGAESCCCAERFPALARRVVVARSVFRLWRGELSLRGAFSGFGAESCCCAERCPHIGRQTLRAARSLRDNDGKRSAIMPQTTENAPGSCSGAGTLRDHAAEREHAAITGAAIPYRRNRARPAPPEPHRITLQGPGLGGPGRNEAGAREATCLIMSHAAASPGQRRCSVIMSETVITDDRPGQATGDVP